MNELAREAAERLAKGLGEGALAVLEDGRGVVVRVRPTAIPTALSLVRKDAACPFDLLVEETAVDYLGWAEKTGLQKPPARFCILYNLFSITRRARLFLETWVEEGESVPSAVPWYQSANWAERHIWDMFGVRFDGHPDLRRIYMPQDYEHFPLRKDFPRRGIDPQDYPQE